MRKHLIAANWKMYKTPAQAVAYIESLSPLLGPLEDQPDVVLFPSTTSLPAAIAAAEHTQLRLGAQNMHWLDAGAYTGETSPQMLTALGCTHVLIGHSERRQYFGETDEMVNSKLKAAIQHGLIPVVCVGEHLEQREANQTADVLKRQTAAALAGLKPEDAATLVMAYEPVWAIGTGRTATPEIAEEAHRLLRDEIAAALGKEVAAATRILYGGSVKPDNAHSLCCMDDVDGALVGGASLDPGSFAGIIANAGKASANAR